MKSFYDCPFRKFSKGYKIAAKNPNYPSMAWGSYLPGDEPGYYCSENYLTCESDIEISFTDCPRLTLSKYKCPICLNDEEITLLYFDSISHMYYCPLEDKWYSPKDLTF